MSEFSYTKEGRRFLIHGDTRCTPKGTLGKYGLGCNFDLDAKVWWTGKEDLAKRAVEVLSEFAAKRAATLAANATYTKFADGTWGVRVPGAVEPGAVVTVRKASGETKQETIGEIVESLESPDGAVIHTIARIARKPRQAAPAGSTFNRSRSGSCRGCRGPVVDAPHHAAMGGYCGGCAFDEYDC